MINERHQMLIQDIAAKYNDDSWMFNQKSVYVNIRIVVTNILTEENYNNIYIADVFGLKTPNISYYKNKYNDLLRYQFFKDIVAMVANMYKKREPDTSNSLKADTNQHNLKDNEGSY